MVGPMVLVILSSFVAVKAQAHLEPLCSSSNYWPPRCEIINETQASCSIGLHNELREGSSKILSLVLCHWPLDFLSPQSLPEFPSLVHMQITKSNITELVDDFPYNENLEELVLSGLKLTWIRENAFSELVNLRVLDLRDNLLATLSYQTLTGPSNLTHVALSGNPWRCTLHLDWLDTPHASGIIRDLEYMECGAALYPRKPVLEIVKFLKSVSKNCPSETCTCDLTSVVWDVRKLVPIITVNCSNRNMDHMPNIIPKNTTTLLLRHNKIRSLRQLLDQHRKVLDVYLDNNQVETIAELEGSYWLNHFRVLSLRANQLQQLPTYALDNALQRNSNALRVYLGLNPWRCDCLFTPAFQELLAKYKNLIVDGNDIRCADVEDDDNSQKRIDMLSRSAVCREDNEPVISALDLVNGVLGSCLIVILLKLGYDYWQYKKHAKLPWIAANIF